MTDEQHATALAIEATKDEIRALLAEPGWDTRRGLALAELEERLSDLHSNDD